MDEDRNKLIWIMLSLGFGIPEPRLWEVLANYSCAEELYEDLKHRRCGFISENEASAFDDISENQAFSVMRSCEKRGIEILTFDDPRFPERLRSISCPPAVLYCRGNTDLLNPDKSAAIIGARKASDYSLRVTEVYSSALSRKGIAVVSGLANGIDQAAHLGAVGARGVTLAVMGCGVDYDYPKGSNKIKDEIYAHGAIISEYLPMTSPKPEYFKIRNRLVSGLSDCVLVIQAGQRSGTLNTVNHALEQSKEVFVIPPHDVLSDDYLGQSELIRDGASEVYDPSQITGFFQKTRR